MITFVFDSEVRIVEQEDPYSWWEVCWYPRVVNSDLYVMRSIIGQENVYSHSADESHVPSNWMIA